MNPYLDSLDFNSYASINHEKETKPSKKNNDEKIGFLFCFCGSNLFRKPSNFFISLLQT